MESSVPRKLVPFTRRLRWRSRARVCRRSAPGGQSGGQSRGHQDLATRTVGRSANFSVARLQEPRRTSRALVRRGTSGHGLDHGMRIINGQGAGALESQRDGGWAPDFAGGHGELRHNSLENQTPRSPCQPAGAGVFCPQRAGGCFYLGGPYGHPWYKARRS